MALAPYKCSLFSWLKQSMPPVRNYLSLSGLKIILCLIVLDVSLYALKFPRRLGIDDDSFWFKVRTCCDEELSIFKETSFW